MKHTSFLVPPDSRVNLSKYDPTFTGKYKYPEECEGKLQHDIAEMVKLQNVLYAKSTYSVLIIIQAMDAAGKDSAVKHVFSGVNPQGCRVVSFKTPSTEELDHDYLWRAHKELPECGGIGVFNRSYYEEVLIARVHPNVLSQQQLPPEARTKRIWHDRFEQINAFEKYLVQNGTIIIKFFLHLSKEEQKRRFIERIDNADKNWKFALADVEERARWNDYRHAYEEMFAHTSTKHAPWYIIPADNKWFTRIVLSDVIIKALKKLDLQYPQMSKEHLESLRIARELLMREKD
jgi:PPK2 family polyphosphate:nucleotide phosphotransferase